MENSKEREKKRILTNQRGGISGHKGTTQTFTPTKTIHHDSTVCPKCNSIDIIQIETKKRNMVSMPPPQKYDVTEHILHEYTCKSCKMTFENDGNLPPRGQFDGTNQKYSEQVFKKNTIQHNQRIIARTIWITYQQYGCTVNFADRQILLQPLYEEIRHEINTSDIVGFDETSYLVEGKNAWTWIARTNTKAHYVVDYSRGDNVLKENWLDFEGIIVSDG